MPEISVVLPTCNRAELLRKCIPSICAGTRRDLEIIVVDGASTDDTVRVLDEASRTLGSRLRVVFEEKREGFVRATNKGFRVATGKYLTWLNDDARPLPGALDAAIDQLESCDRSTAFVAMFHRWHKMWNIAYETVHNHRVYRLCHVRGTLYANFPLGRREVYQKLGFFDERYFTCAADPDLSLKAWDAGMKIVPALGAMIDHDEFEDERRMSDSDAGAEDNRKLFEKWELPPRNPTKNDFDPTNPCTLRNLRQLAEAA